MADTSEITPQQVLDGLMAGNARYVAGNLTSFDADLSLIKQSGAETREPPHEPFAALLACADARVPAEVIFDQIMGYLFTTRIAGNITTPEIIASLEYSIAGLKQPVKVIMVLGHQYCGAVRATISRKPVPGQISALYPPIFPAVTLSPSPDEDERIKANARFHAIILRDASPVIAPLVKNGTLLVVAAYYDVVTGEVTLLPLPNV